MSMHLIPMTNEEREGLIKHRLPVDKPSQLSDCFRLGMKYSTENSKQSNTIRELEQLVKDSKQKGESLQAKIDQLMLEYCPEEMTADQIENWKNHQVVSVQVPPFTEYVKSK